MSQRYEREIDEILRQFDGSPPGAPRPLRRPARRGGFRQRALQALWSTYTRRWRWTPAEIMLAAYAGSLIAVAVMSLPLFQIFAWPVGWAVLILYVAGYVGGYRRWSRQARSWRGRSIDYNQRGFADFWTQLRNRWRRRRW